MPGRSDIEAGKAFVRLSLKDDMTRGLRRASAQLKAWGSAATVIGTAVLAPLAAATKIFVDMGSKLVDASARTGASVAALSTLGYAAEQTGGSFELLEGSFRKMQKVIVDAASGSKTASDSLARLGLSASQLRSLSPEEQFKTIADAVSQIPDPTERAAAAMAIFGKSGTQLLPMLVDGRKGIEALQQAARDLGLELSDRDAKAAEAFGDTLDDLWKVVKVGAFNVGAALVPALTEAAKSFTKIAQTTAKWIKENQELVVWLGKIGIALAATGIALTVLGTGLGIATKAVKALTTAFVFLSKNPAVAAILGVTAVVLGAVEAFRMLREETARLAGSWVNWMFGPAPGKPAGPAAGGAPGAQPGAPAAAPDDADDGAGGAKRARDIKNFWREFRDQQEKEELEAAQGEARRRRDMQQGLMAIREQEARLQEQLAEQQIETTLEGIDKERALLDLEEKRAVLAAQQAGVDPELVTKLFGLRRQQLEQDEADRFRAEFNMGQVEEPDQLRGRVASTFSAAAAAAMGQGGNGTLAEIRKSNEHLAEVRKASQGTLAEVKLLGRVS